MDDDTSEPWPRNFKFVIPVRDLAFWNREDIKQLLVQALRFLSDDTYEFVFWQDQRRSVRQGYLEFGANEDWPFHGVDRVLMLSGGLDSLSGALETAAQGRNLVLVSHRPVSHQASRQTRLFSLLRETCKVPMIHVPVWVNKDENLGRESSQRTRSFLYATLGAIVAESVRANGISFFENGVVSLNLPVADEVVGSRASRTAHPHTLDLFNRLFQQVLSRDFVLDNPFVFRTKKEVVEAIAANGGSHLIGYTCSCAHQGIFQSGTQWHCGHCSQCIDRRIAILAAGLEEHDPTTDYEVDVFTGPRKEGFQQRMAIDYAQHAVELCGMDERTMSAKFNLHLSRAVRPFPQQAEAARGFIDLHHRHGAVVRGVLQQQMMKNSQRIVEASLPKSSMLALLASQLHRPSAGDVPQAEVDVAGAGDRIGGPKQFSAGEEMKASSDATVNLPGVNDGIMDYKAEDQPWFQAPIPLLREVEERELLQLADEIDVVLMTATEVERDAVLRLLDSYPRRRAVLQGHHGPETYFLGKFGAFKAVVTKCRMGSLEAGSVTLAVDQATRVWRPRAIIMAGIAFGKDPTNQEVADVLVASQVISYEQQRVGEEIIERGTIPPSNPTLLNRFENALGWTFTRPDNSACKLHVGPILSGEKLVDEPKFKASLFRRFPQAIGGEMEGVGPLRSGHPQ